ncbi:sigma-E factor negative regulatory protein, partial [Marilutibacter aestuarii]
MMSSPSNPNASSIEADRETLCALFDGELQGDAARFAHRRLGHDAEWRAAFGRWQLAGDVMRRQSGGLAPSDFAARVARALETDHAFAVLPRAAGSDLGDARSRWRRGWIPGAALAASVAVAALFVARPLGQSEAPAGLDASPQVADRDGTPTSVPPPSQVVAATPQGADATQAGLATAAAAAVA